MSLKELEVRYATKRSKDYKLADGQGFYLLVRPTGSANWTRSKRSSLAICSSLNISDRISASQTCRKLQYTQLPKMGSAKSDRISLLFMTNMTQSYSRNHLFLRLTDSRKIS